MGTVESGEEDRMVEIPVVSGVVGLVVCEVSVHKGLSEVGKLVGWDLSREEGQVSVEFNGEVEEAEDEESGSGEEGKEWLGQGSWSGVVCRDVPTTLGPHI